MGVERDYDDKRLPCGYGPSLRGVSRQFEVAKEPLPPPGRSVQLKNKQAVILRHVIDDETRKSLEEVVGFFDLQGGAKIGPSTVGTIATAKSGHIHHLDDDEVVGLSFTNIVPQQALALVEWVFVPDHHQGKGLGTVLFADACERAMQHSDVKVIAGKVIDQTGKILRVAEQLGASSIGEKRYEISIDSVQKRAEIAQRLREILDAYRPNDGQVTDIMPVED